MDSIYFWNSEREGEEKILTISQKPSRKTHTHTDGPTSCMSCLCMTVNMYSHMPARGLLSVYKLWATIVPGLNPCYILHSLGLKSRDYGWNPGTQEWPGAGLCEQHHHPSFCCCTHLGMDPVLPPCVCVLWLAQLLCLWLLLSPHPPHTLENMG